MRRSRYVTIPDVSDGRGDLFCFLAKGAFDRQALLGGGLTSNFYRDNSEIPPFEEIDQAAANSIPPEHLSTIVDLASAVGHSYGAAHLPPANYDKLSILWKKSELSAYGYANLQKYQITLGPTLYMDCVAVQEASDAYTGVALHEISHLVESLPWEDTTLIQFGKDHDILDDTSGKPRWKGKRGQLLGAVSNYLEDVLVESSVIQKAPVYGGYIETLHRVMSDRAMARVPAEGDWDHLPDVGKMLSLFTTFMRAPFKVTKEMREFCTISGANVFEAYRRILQGPPKNTHDSVRMAQEIYNFVIEEADEYYDPSEENEGDSRVQAEQAAGTLQEGDDEGGEVPYGVVDMQEGNITFANGESRPLTEQEQAGLKRFLEDHPEYEEWSTAEVSRDPEETVIDCVTIFPKGDNAGDRGRYNRSMDKVRGHIEAMRHALSIPVATRMIENTELMEGMLDRQSLWKASFQDDIFYLEDPLVATGGSICLLMDESGSMQGDKYEKCREVALCMTHALVDNPLVELEVYSYTTGYPDADQKLDCYYSHLLKVLYSSKTGREPGGLGNYGTRGQGNQDYMSIDLAAKRFIGATENPNRVMFVISDGIPIGCDGVTDAVGTTRKMVEKWRGEMDIIGIDIEGEDVETIYQPHFLRYTDLGTFVQQMRTLIMGYANRWGV